MNSPSLHLLQMIFNSQWLGNTFPTIGTNGSLAPPIIFLLPQDSTCWSCVYTCMNFTTKSQRLMLRYLCINSKSNQVRLNFLFITIDFRTSAPPHPLRSAPSTHPLQLSHPRSAIAPKIGCGPRILALPTPIALSEKTSDIPKSAYFSQNDVW